MTAIGQTLSHFKLTDLLGRGGMGEVYRAKDLTLGRDVAIKVLPPEFALDPDRVARFQREAKLLASLNHPNIAAIYGLEESNGTHFLVLELVEGETLAEQLKRGPIPVEESMKLALQIAEALEAAHEKGIIHRDLKPANTKITPEGKVKVLDFGLAKAFADDQALNSSDSPTLSLAATRQGVILGTAAYMSPEQARGRAVDKRADIWAFGCVLYEMLTGQTAFRGEDVSEILASVIKGDVNLDLLPANTHPRVREILSRCLQKDLKKRRQDIGDVRFELEQVVAHPALVEPAAPARHQSKFRSVLPWAITTVLIVALGIALWSLWHGARSFEQPLVRLDVDLGPDVSLGSQNGADVVISPDGKRLVFVSKLRLFTRRLDQPRATELAGTEGASEPFF